MRRQPEERGAAAVEFAIVSTLLVTLCLGIIEFGNLFFVYGSVAGAARESARVYAIGQDEADARRVAVDSVSDFVGLEESMVHISGCAAAPVGDGGTGGEIPVATVTISYPYEDMTGFFSFLESIVLTGEGAMRCNG